MRLSEMDATKYLKVLVYGDSGTSKTVGACSFPTPIYVFDFDAKISSAASFYAGDQARLEHIEADNYAPQPGDKPGAAFARFAQKLSELETLAAKGDLKYRTVVLDSVTTFSDQMLKEIVRTNPGIKRPQTNMEQATCQQDYGILSMHFKNTILRLLQLPANIVVTGHIYIDKDETTGEIIRRCSVPGKSAEWLPIVFEEVYRSHVVEEKSQRTFMVQTQPDAKFKLRSQLRGIPANVRFVYDELTKYFPQIHSRGN